MTPPCRRLHCDSLMVMAAVRYCLGRASYIVPACTEWLDGLWPSLDAQTKKTLRRDIQRAEDEGLRWKVFHDWQTFLDTHPEAP